MIPRGFTTLLLCLSIIFALFLYGVLFGVSLFFNDEKKVDAAWVEQNFSLPCTQLDISHAFFDVDLNVATLTLKTPPPASYWESLAAAGWNPGKGKAVSPVQKII